MKFEFLYASISLNRRRESNSLVICIARFEFLLTSKILLIVVKSYANFLLLTWSCTNLRRIEWVFQIGYLAHSSLNLRLCFVLLRLVWIYTIFTWISRWAHYLDICCVLFHLYLKLWHVRLFLNITKLTRLWLSLNLHSFWLALKSWMHSCPSHPEW